MMAAEPIEIVEVDAAEATRRRQELVDVYREAFRPPPYQKGENVVRHFQSSFERHTGNEGFRCIAALAGSAAQLCGFAYGYTSRPGQWWHDQVVERLDGATREKWFGDAFEIVELAVHPAMQGQGVGGQIHDELLRPVPHRTAVLSTLDAETRGLHLYQRRGWRTLLSAFRFDGVRDPYLIMGLDLSAFQRR